MSNINMLKNFLFSNKMARQNDMCLVAIFRDELHLVKDEQFNDEVPLVIRCLRSVAEMMDSYVICVTSKDGEPNPELETTIKNFMDERGISGHILNKKWRDFGFNKSWLLHQAQSSAGGGLCNNAKYLFWLDAKETFIMRSSRKYPSAQDKAELLQFMSQTSAGIVYLQTEYGNQLFRRWQIARNDQPYKWVGPVHELFCANKPTTEIYYDKIVNYVRCESSSSKNPRKYDYYAEWLEDYLIDHPNEPRSTFYLAQTYGDGGKIDKAIEYYNKRVGLGGFSQEEYIAMLRAGRYHIFKMNNSINAPLSVSEHENSERKVYQTQQLDLAIECFNKAISITPSRLEAPFELMMAYFNAGRFNDALDVTYKYINGAPIVDTDLFVEKDIYEWKYEFFAAINASHAGDPNLSLILSNRILERGKLPEDERTRNDFVNNLEIYKRQVHELQITPPAPPSSEELKLKELEIHDTKSISENANSSIVPFPSPLTLSPPNVIIYDNFFRDPDAIRKFALSQDFPITGNYPGRRTKSFASPEHKAFFESILRKKITYWPTDNYNGSFQYTLESQKSWIHRDNTDYSAMVYLTPNAPLRGGTETYQHKLTKGVFANTHNEKFLAADTNNFGAWDILDSVANVYNRLVIFNGRQSHMSGKYFGDDINTGRLFLIFFFDVEK